MTPTHRVNITPLSLSTGKNRKQDGMVTWCWGTRQYPALCRTPEMGCRYNSARSRAWGQKGWHPWFTDDQVRLWQGKEGTCERLAWDEPKSSTQGCHLPAGLTVPTVTLCTCSQPQLPTPNTADITGCNKMRRAGLLLSKNQAFRD